MNVKELARDLVCELEQFLTPERFTTNNYMQDKDGRSVYPSDIVYFGRTPARFCELGALAEVFSTKTGIRIDPAAIPNAYAYIPEEYGYRNKDGCLPEHWHLTPEQENALFVAYTTLMEKGKAFVDPDDDPDDYSIPAINDSEGGYEKIKQLNQEACAALRETPECEGATK